MFIRAVSIVLAVAGIAGCTTASTPPTASISPSPTASCGAVSDLVVVPNGDAEFSGYALAHAGPVWFSAFGPVRSGKAVLADFFPGVPTKIVIHPDVGTHPEVQVRGIECASGKPFRFCYNQGTCGFSGSPVPGPAFEARGDAVVTIAANQHDDDTGYMLFPRPGKYQVSVEQGSRVLGSVVLQVG